MNYSQTYASVIIMVLAQVLPKLGVQIGNDAISTTVYTVISIGAGVYALYRRYKAGGVTAVGTRV